MRRLLWLVAISVVILGCLGAAPVAAEDTPLPSPDQAQIDDARDALDRLEGQGAQGGEVAGPPPASEPGERDDSGLDWWLIGAAAFLLLVVSEFGRITPVPSGRRRPIG